ncbi:MAG TPA: protein kinase [Gemmatimonadaceae bacterium]|nr:protein kinase [Gemmatimonadaceae bacterium]
MGGDLTTPFTPQDTLAPLRAALAGRYEIAREIGQGAFATVYLARDTRHERSVALKVLNADPSSETGELRFIREIRLLAGLQHPNILPLHDSGHVEDLLYYVMPYVGGETLRTRMDRERQLQVEVAVAIAYETADALAYAHAQGVIHRDIKPENILLSAGHPIVADFGIARAIDLAGVRQLTRTGNGSPGTPAYMSPEQLMADTELDGRTDVYSLGCVLYEMLTGKPPFAGKDGFVRRFTEPPPLPSAVRKELPPWLDDVVAKALARSPVDRYPTAALLARALRGSTVHDSNPPELRPGSDRSPAMSADRQAYKPVSREPAKVREIQQASIGVLPFANMSADPENEYFSDGITEEILNALASIPTLKVASRTSAFALKGKSLSIAEIGQLLNVKTVLEGSVRRMGQRVRITAQLINTADGFHLWSERYDREVEDVFAIQDEIARTIVERLKVKLTTEQDEALGRRQTENIEAYELYLRGRHCSHRWNISGMMQKALGYFEAALAKDPDYALAFHGVADVYSLLGLYAFVPPATVVDKAIAAATRAVELAPELAEAQTSLGFVQLLDWDWQGAKTSLLRAIELNPRYAQAHMFYGWLMSTLGKPEEAAEAVRIGDELEPYLPATSGVSALVSYHARRFDQAIRESERALERDPTSALSLLCISMAHAAKGAHKEAILLAERGVGLSPDVNFLRGVLGAVLAMANEKEAARKVLDDLLERSKRAYVGPTVISWIYAHIGDRDSAFEWLEKAYDQRDCTLGFGLRAPMYDVICDDPRFGGLLTKLGLS